ncbi:UvrD-helicase domain-containing protein [Flavobacterium sp. JP2137]|uniref:UvrD-helicase domain-containing protein n=1 Tax=Flavobacterium sp. JP2137 TaxID=3414510 RepID=UPI003D2FB843
MTTASFSIYNASAGSGKTHTLVKEYLKILLSDKTNDAYKNILAITFTNKAVEEMKSRIVSSLFAFSQEEVPEKHWGMLEQIEAETGIKAELIKSKSKVIIKNIIHNYAAFDISTIDKFTHKIIRSFAHDLNLPITFDVSLESEELLQEAVDAIVSRAGTDRELTDLLIAFSIDKADNDKSWDVTRELMEIGYLLMNENNRDEIALFQEVNLPDFVAVRDRLKAEIKKISAQTKALGSEALQWMRDENIDEKSFSRGTFPNHLKKIQTDEVTAAHKRFVEFDDVQINKTAADRAQIEAVIPRWLALLQTVYKAYAKRAFYEAFLKNITPLSLLNTIRQELDRIQEEQNILSISQFNAIIYKEIQNQPAPFIYERLGERYRHFFIDEFQDTSEMQWLNLIPLIDNALAGEDLSGTKGTLMIVGDPKQSIYRWRGGKAEQFIALSKGDNPFSNPSKETVVLGKNYRSYSEVINFNNAFFKELSHSFTQADYQDLYANNSSQETNAKTGGYVNIQFLPASESDEEVETKEALHVKATLETIQKVKAQGFQYRDIVVLTRKRAAGVALANYLTEWEVPILSSDSLLIDNATEVRLIIQVLRFLKNERDREAKALMLYYVASKQPQGTPIHDFIAEGVAIKDIPELEKWLASKGVLISFNGCRKKSLYEAVEDIVRAFLQDKSSISYVLYFLDLVLERTIKSQYSISDFLYFWENNGQKFSIPTPEGVDAVRIMTIHKSKGLEFPVVIFPFAEEDYSRASRNKLWLDLEDEDLDLPKALVDSKKEVAEYGAWAERLYQEKQQEELLDNVNVLYVALTRAEEQLYIVSSKNITRSGELQNNMSKFFLEFLIKSGRYTDEDFSYDFGEAIKCSKTAVPDVEHHNKTIYSVDQLIDFKSIKIAQREALMWDTESQKAIEYGNILHQIMAYVYTIHDVDLALDKSVEAGLITESQRSNFKELVESIVFHPELAPYFAENGQVFNERTIFSATFKNIKPDRVTIRGNKAYLLDYKTGKNEEAHIKQVREYQLALEDMGYEVAKKIILYTGDHINMVHLP